MHASINSNASTMNGHTHPHSSGQPGPEQHTRLADTISQLQMLHALNNQPLLHAPVEMQQLLRKSI